MTNRATQAIKGRSTALLSALLGLLAVATVLAGPVSASSAYVDGGAGAEPAGVVATGQRVPVPESSIEQGLAGRKQRHAQAMWLWRSGGRAYFLKNSNRESNDRAAANESLAPPTSELVAVDATTGAVLERRLLDPGVQNAFQQSVAIDEDGGRLFVPYFDRPMEETFLGKPIPGTGMDATRGELCASALFHHNCVNGFYVIDATTLEVTGRIPLRNLGIDGLPPTSLTLWAASYSPPRQTGDAGKLLALVSEDGLPEERYGHNQNVHPVEGDWRTQTGTNLIYAVQMDPGRKVIDWVTRVEGCRSRRELRQSQPDGNTQQMPWRAVIARSRSVEQPAVFVACHTGTSQQAVFASVPLDEHSMAPGSPVRTDTSVDPDVQPVSADPRSQGRRLEQSPAQRVFAGPDKTFQFLFDPGSERILARVIDAGAEVWWVFDAARWAVVGTIGIGRIGGVESAISGIDGIRGRLYVLTGATAATPGLFIADIRRNPLPQALVFPGFAALWTKPDGNQASASSFPIVIDAPLDGSARVFVATGPTMVDSTVTFQQVPYWSVLRDTVPVSADVEAEEEFEGRSLDLDEIAGVTDAAFDGTARGYGARLLLVGGAEGAARVGPLDPAGAVFQPRDHTQGKKGAASDCLANLVPGCPGVAYEEVVVPPPCTSVNRDLVVGAVGLRQPAVVDVSGGRGAADPLVIDSGSTADAQAPTSRCTGTDWDELWGKALFSRGPAGEPAANLPAEVRTAECLSTDERPSDATGDPVAGVYAARVSCEETDASGFAYARGVSAGGVGIGESLSSFRIYRDPGRGIVARVESVARAVSIQGVVRIDSVRGVAESWANGRRFTPPEPVEGRAYNPNCDFERTAGTCFTRHVFGVWTPGYACGPCGDEKSFVEGMSRGMGGYGSARLRDPDPKLAKGTENGFIAAINKPERERFPDLVLNNDLLQTVLPTLEIIRQAPPNRTLTGGGPAGRQIIQLAGVEVSSSYGISCLLAYDEATNTCGAPAEPPGSLTVSLTDADGKALAGGAFEVRQDADTDGVVGLKDALLPNGACLTTDDGVGTCKFETLQPGSYLVSQVAAPPGYGKVADPFVVELASGEARTVTFQNTSNVSTIQVSAADEAGKPVSGAVFAVYPDPDSDGKVAGEAKPAASCTTDASGSCAMQVPAGSYVLVQSSAPGGLEPIEPVAFTFASGGQTAAVGVVNYPAGGAPAVEPAAGPIEYSEPLRPVVTETVGDYQPSDTMVADEPQVSVPEAVGGTIVRVIQAPGDALRLLSRDPKQAVAWTASLTLFALALMAIRRRQEALTLVER